MKRILAAALVMGAASAFAADNGTAYSNPSYGMRLTAPSATTMCPLIAPEPNHGARIVSDKSTCRKMVGSVAEIDVNANYNVLDFHNSLQFARAVCKGARVNFSKFAVGNIPTFECKAVSDSGGVGRMYLALRRTGKSVDSWIAYTVFVGQGMPAATGRSVVTSIRMLPL